MHTAHQVEETALLKIYRCMYICVRTYVDESYSEVHRHVGKLSIYIFSVQSNVKQNGLLALHFSSL
jgi:hypothetical protein